MENRAIHQTGVEEVLSEQIKKRYVIHENGHHILNQGQNEMDKRLVREKNYLFFYLYQIQGKKSIQVMKTLTEINEKEE